MRGLLGIFVALAIVAAPSCCLAQCENGQCLLSSAPAVSFEPVDASPLVVLDTAPVVTTTTVTTSQTTAPTAVRVLRTPVRTVLRGVLTRPVSGRAFVYRRPVVSYGSGGSGYSVHRAATWGNSSGFSYGSSGL